MPDFGPPTPLTQDELLDVLRRNLDDHWIAGLLEDPSSSAIFIAQAAALLRVQTALDENISRNAFLLTAQGAARAVSTVRLTRASGSSGTIPTTVRLLDQFGMMWRPSADYSVAASGSTQTIDVPIQSDRYGYFLNSFEPLTYVLMDDLFDPNFTITTGVDPATDGRGAYLDLLGRERDRPRAADETDEAYRHRLLFLEDAVSPKALAECVPVVLDAFLSTRSLTQLILEHGLRALQEPFSDRAQLAQTGLLGVDGAYADDITFANDPHGPLVRSIDDQLAWLDVWLPTFPDGAEARLFADDGFADDPELGFPDLPPGVAITGPIGALADELDRKRAGGVRVRIIFGEDVPLIRHPQLGTTVQVGDWRDELGSAIPDDLVASLQTFDADDTYVVTDLGTGSGSAMTANDLLFAYAAVPPPVSVSHLALRALVRRRNTGVGTDPRLSFLLRPTTAGAAVRIGTPITVDHDDWREIRYIVEQNPVTASAWTLADIAGSLEAGLANTAAAGATDDLLVAEMVLEIFANYG